MSLYLVSSFPKYSSNVSLQMYMTENDQETVDEYFGKLEKRYKDTFDTYNLESTEDVKMDGSDAKKYIYKITVGGVEYKQMQAIVVRGAVFYTLTYTAAYTGDGNDTYTALYGDLEAVAEALTFQ